MKVTRVIPEKIEHDVLIQLSYKDAQILLNLLNDEVDWTKSKEYGSYAEALHDVLNEEVDE